jgi:hypothetical protein
MPRSKQPQLNQAGAERPLQHAERHQQEHGDAGAPFSREEVKSDLRRALLASVNHVAVIGPDQDIVEALLGFSFEQGGDFGADAIDTDKIQFKRFAITGVLDRAYDFAFQVGRRAHRHAMNETEFLRMLTFRRGSPRFIWGGVDTPMEEDESPICRTIDTAEARQELLWGNPLTVRQLALLARMTEAAVRTSLSKESIRTEGSRRGEDGLGQVPHEAAARWLAGRRGFVPTLEPEPSDPAYVEDILRLLRSQGFEVDPQRHFLSASLGRIANDAEVDPDWLLEVATGRPATLDIEALTRVARAVYADVPAFVGRAVEMTLRATYEPPDGDSEIPAAMMATTEKHCGSDT